MFSSFLSASELQVEMIPDEVVEGETVTLTCKITCSPTVSWYKSGNLLSSSSNPLRLRPVSQRDSGDYSCAAQGEDYRSPAVTLDVQYPPKSVSVSISPSGETVEGSSVTLTCSSDANPPVETYSWYKVNESSPVGSGQSYSFTLSFNSSGWFYCVAQNKYGNQRAAAVPLTVNGSRSVVQYVVLGVTVGFGCLFVIIGVLFMWRKRRRGSADDATSSQNIHSSPTEGTYTALDPQTRSYNDTYDTLAKVHSSPTEGTYTALDPQTRSYNDTYDTLATVHPSPPDDTPAARDSQSISPDYINLPRLSLSSSELQVEMIPDEVVEGKTVTLTCKNTCSPTVSWYKSGNLLSSSSNRLRLRSVSQRDSGDYSCAAQGEDYRSPAVTLDVQYPPKRVSVSISPSGETVEGSSVTLTCSSDANPPVETYSWYKGILYRGRGETYTINRISSEDSGEYRCWATNKHGTRSSPAVSLNVLYPPKSVSVSISPSGEMVEGSSVTLTCSSDANPPVEFNWFKGRSLKSKENIYTIRKISSEDRGEYKCKSSNQYGEKYSEEMTVNVLYPPKNVSVSISPSGEMVEGSSVTLTCSSDANPPVETYSWYKVNEGSPVGSGQSYSFTLSFSSSGWFYCVAQNKYGNQRAAAVPLTVNGSRSVVLYVVLGVTVGFGCLFVIIGVLFMWRKRRRGSADDATSSQNIHSSPTEDTYTALDPQTRSYNDTYDTLAKVHSSPTEDTYTALDPQTRSYNDTYDTLANIHSSPTEGTYTALDPQTRSYNDTYDTLATVHPSPPDDTPAARDSQSISPDYNNLPAARKQQ
ncbi:B-cell receptor CD22-like [Neoarius graeffei]|uniref:B-cell receptor CD22-like n=1 Tax=Neoarius graeffei TaxID=443677 RepID=UPI00298D5EAC|nr:B-cell receptor CD22-like [Neoarius graeffei]